MHAQSHRTLRYMDGSPSGSSVHGIFQARILEWVAISFPRDLPNPGIKPTFPVSPALHTDSLPLSHQESDIKVDTKEKFHQGEMVRK